jgi:hypothetical protein
LHRLSPSFILGFHGCSADTAKVLVEGASFQQSTNDYDWLGHGVYFWENNPERASAFVNEKFQREGNSNPTAVVGAIIDLGLCLDATTQSAAQAINEAHDAYISTLRSAGLEPPKNDGGSDRLRRRLDCAVINFLHEARSFSKEDPIDTVRGVFIEGTPIYSDAGFYAKTHIQVAVRNQSCIKGIFLPR